jgi:hypothetical protein
MPGVYGNLLLSFPELMKTYDVFKMEPRGIGGYGKRYGIRKVDGYWSWRKQSKLEVRDDSLVLNYQAIFWAKDDLATGESNVAQGDFMEIGKEVFRVLDDQNFIHEGGFTKCLMEKLGGVTDRQTANTKVDEAIANDY